MKICINKPDIKTSQRTFASKQILKSKSLSFLDDYLKKNNNEYTKTIIKDLRQLMASPKAFLKESNIIGVVGQGGLSTIFDLGNNEVLKCSLENPLEFRMHNATFDIPFLSPVEKFGKTFFVKEVKADTANITIEDCERVIKNIYKEGFEPSKDLDKYRTWQIGKYNNKPYLLDTRAALPRPNRFSEYIYNCCRDYKRVFQLKSWTAEDIVKDEAKTAELVKKEGLKVLHMDETPRKNLDFIEGINLVNTVVKENIKYEQWNRLQGAIIMFETIVRGSLLKATNKIKSMFQ